MTDRLEDFDFLSELSNLIWGEKSRIIFGAKDNKLNLEKKSYRKTLSAWNTSTFCYGLKYYSVFSGRRGFL
jgi:hypothetical protein